MRGIIGVPGAGKTTYLAKKLTQLDPTKYIFTSLTNASIRAFLTKIGRKDKFMSVRTIYGLAYKKLENELKLDENKKKYLESYEHKLSKLFAEYNISHLYKDDIQSILTLLTLEALEKQIDLMQALDNIESEIKKILLLTKQIKKIFALLEEIIESYHQNKFYSYQFLLYDAMKENLDFFKVFDRDSELEPEIIVFDEFQDTPVFVFKYIKKLGKLNKLWVAGDPAQEIFTFLKTNPRYLMSRLAKLEYLSKTYRFGKEIADLANYILKRLGYKFRIEPTETDSKVLVFKYNLSNLLSIINRILKYDNEVIVLVRTKEQARYLEKKLESRYNVINLERYNFAQLKEHLRQVQEILATSRRTILDYFKSKEQLLKEAIDIVAPSKKIKEMLLRILSKKVVYVSTVHAVKGLEFNSVIFWDAIPRKIELLLGSGELKEEEELKVIYVAITRAKHLLVLLREQDGYFSELLNM